MDSQELKLEIDKSRAGVLTESVKALLLVNGGGAVALLAFLQAVWSTNTGLARLTLIGIAWMGAGIVFALLVQPFRFTHSKLVQRTGDRRTMMWMLYRSAEYLSIVAFMVALVVLVSGGLRLLPADA